MSSVYRRLRELTALDHDMDNVFSHKILTEALRASALDVNHSEQAAIIETHISSVILLGDYAYKIKKPVNLGFVDFSTLAKRKYYCEEEIRLNRRLAPQLYISVVPIRGTPENPQFYGEKKIIEYAVKMHRFPQSCLFEAMARNDQLNERMIVNLANVIADFHLLTESSAAFNKELGSAKRTHYWFRENLRQLGSQLIEGSDLDQIQVIQQWGETAYEQLHDVFCSRKEQGFVKACHGDLHLGNIVAMDNMPVVFDCIEFNNELIWIDPISEIAFLCMDLDKHGLCNLSAIFCNHYLRHTGDYDGMALFPYYCTYRALVRAKVALLRQAEIRDLTECRRYISLAKNYMQFRQPTLIITCGVSGSGKSYWSDMMAKRLGLIHIRSDIERKRLFGARKKIFQSSTEMGIYSREASLKTYGRLEEIAAVLLDAGLSVIVDATFLALEQRLCFRALADRHRTKFFILAFAASLDTLRERVTQRSREGSDPSEADIGVLEFQLAHFKPLSLDEGNIIECDSESESAMDAVCKILESRRRIEIDITKSR